jgi:hypothetical protein
MKTNVTFLVAASGLLRFGIAFAPPGVARRIHQRAPAVVSIRTEVALSATGSPQKKKRRRRKEPPGQATAGAAAEPLEKPKATVAAPADTAAPDQEDEMIKEELSMLADVAKFKFESDDSITMGRWC